jgi:hypothetical protein
MHHVCARPHFWGDGCRRAASTFGARMTPQRTMRRRVVRLGDPVRMQVGVMQHCGSAQPDEKTR